MKDKFKKYYMRVALDTTELSYCIRARVGAVIVQGDSIIAYGYNGTPSGDDNVCEVDNKTKEEVIHAEINAICKVAKSTQSCYNASMFLTHEPCIECAKAIKQSGIKKLYYHQLYDGSRSSGLKFLEDRGIVCEQVDLENI